MTQPSRILWLGVFAATLLLPSRLIPQARSKGSLQVTSQRSRTTPSASSRSLIASANGSLDQSKARLMNSYGRLPLSFEANRGQADARVKFQSQAGGYTLFLTERGEAVFVFRKPGSRPNSDFPPSAITPHSEAAPAPAVVRLKLLDVNRAPGIEGQGELLGKANYLIGRDPKKWRTNVPLYAKVKYTQIYPGVDLVYYGNQRQLESDFIVAPGAEPSRIAMNIQGATAPSVDSQGDLVISTGEDSVKLKKPIAYQELNGERMQVQVRYRLSGQNRIAFELGAYDRRKALVIDPVLAYSTYLGGLSSTGASGIAVDALGYAYVVGRTGAVIFPATPSVFPTTPGAFDTNSNFVFTQAPAFVTKMNRDGTSLVYSTFLGGTLENDPFAIAVDSSGNAYVTGCTSSLDFPVTPGAFQTTGSGLDGSESCGHAFVTKLNSQGSALVYSTYLGGNGGVAFDANGLPYPVADTAYGIAINASGNAYVAGTTTDPTFPTTPGAFQTAFKSGSGTIWQIHPSSPFVTELNAAGTQLVYSTFLSGRGTDSARSIALDAAGNTYITGQTGSFLENDGKTRVDDFPTTPGAFQSILPPGIAGYFKPFVAKLNGAGSALVYATFLGGSGPFDSGLGIALDNEGNAYVTGQTYSADFPTTPGAFQTSFGGGISNAFVTKLNASGSALLYSTYLGGNSNSAQDYGLAISVDGSGNAYVTGPAFAKNFPTTPGAFQTSSRAPGAFQANAFFTKLNAGGCSLGYSTYLGGSMSDQGLALALDSSDNAYIAGSASSLDFPTTAGAFQATFPSAVSGQGITEAFVTKISAGTGNSTDFCLNAASPLTVMAGSSANSTVEVSSIDGFNSPVTLMVSAPPIGVSVSLSSPTVTPPLGGVVSSTLTVSASANAVSSTFILTVTGTSGSLTHSAQVKVILLAPVQTATKLQSSSPTSIVTQPVTFTATVTAVPANAGQPSGNVVFRDGPQVLGTGSATSGQATFTTSSLAIGQHSITAEYQATGIFLGSKSAPVVVTVSPAGGGTGTPSCVCSLTGAYVAPATPVDASDRPLSPRGIYTLSATMDTSNPATGTSLSITRNKDQVVVFPQRNLPITTNFGFSPDDNRFVLHYLSGSIDTVELYDLTVQPARKIVSTQSPSGTNSTAISFSASGRYLLYEYVYVNGSSTLAHLQLYQIQNVAGQLLVYDSGDFSFVSVQGSGEDTYGVVGQGFSPDNPETSFVYSNVTGQGQGFGQSQSQWNLVSLVTPQKTALKTIALADVSDIWEYSPCGDVVGLIRQLQPNATGPSTVAEVDLIAAATGLSLNPGGYPAATIQLLLNCTANGQQVTDNSQNPPAIVTLAPNAGCTNTPTGAKVTVLPSDTGGSGLAPVTITFNNVTVPGATTLLASSSGPQLPPNTQPGNPAKYFYLTTTAVFSSATVCISYADLAFGSSSIILLHNENGTWVAPSNQTIDSVHQTICATVTSFSPFTIAEQASSATVSSISAPGVVYGSPASVTVSVSSSTGSVTGTVVLSVDSGAAISMPLSNGSATFNVGVLNAGSHSLSASFGTQGSFSASKANGTLSVAQAPLTLTANNASKIYGAAVPTLAFSASGFVNRDTTASLTTQPTLNTTATAASPVGAYAINISGAVDANYSITYAQGTLTVTPAPLTITANNAAKNLNAPNPVFMWTPSGFVNGDTTSVLTTNPTCNTTASANSPVGSYPITCSGASAANYNFSYVSGTLRIQYATNVGHLIQPPINADGTSVFNQGRTVPAKFSVYDANGVSVGTPGVVSSFFLTGILSGTATATVEDVVDTNNPDTAFRWDPTSQQWIFNITTGNLSAGSTYIYNITLNDGSTISFQYGLR